MRSPPEKQRGVASHDPHPNHSPIASTGTVPKVRDDTLSTRALTPWQAAAACLRGCVEASQESLDEREWEDYVRYFVRLAAKYGGEQLARELRKAPR
jgi:hypothetical protein